MKSQITPALLLLGAAAGAVWYLRRSAGQLIEKGVQAAEKGVHAPFQLFRDPKADSSTPGTEAWVNKQLDRGTEALGMKPAPKPLETYDPETRDFDVINNPRNPDVPMVVYEALPHITPYKTNN